MLREESNDSFASLVQVGESNEKPSASSHEQDFLNHSLLYQFFEKMPPQKPLVVPLNLPGLTDSISLKEYQKRDISLMSEMEDHPVGFETCLCSKTRYIRGGMLAEDMGTGKTVCIIGLILKSKGKVPYSVVQAGRGVIPLKQMCAEIITNPIQNFEKDFHRLPNDLIDYLRHLPPLPRSYLHIPQLRVRGSIVKSVEVHLTKATLLVVPPALMQQVQQEFNKFTTPNALEILYCARQDDLPSSPAGFWPYDVVVVSNLLLRTGSINLTQRVVQKEKCTMACQFLSPGCPNCEQGAEPSVLLRTHWLRVVIDEGHIMGAQSSNQTRLAKMLFADRKWLVSGTPTPDAEPSRELEYLFGLLVFLRLLDDTRECRYLWRRHVAEPYEDEARRDVSLSASLSSSSLIEEERSVPVLEAILRHVLVRNNSGVIERENPLPPLRPPQIRVLPFQTEEAIRYQQLVGQVHTNLITSRFDEQDCLFHPKNSKYVLEAFSTLRRSGTWFAGLQQFEREVCIEAIHDDLYGIAEKPYPVNTTQSRTLIEIFNTLRWNAFRQVEDTFASAKLNYVLKRLSTPSEQGGLAGEKVIVFSMFTETLAWLAEELKRNNINFCEFYTNLKPEARASALVTFNTSAEKHVILMKTDLAAYGINLACASHIFFMEPVLDRTKEQQAIKRAHRIGHDPAKPVTVEKLVMEDTLEHMQLLNEGSFGLSLEPASAALTVSLDTSLSPPCYQREFRALNGTPPYRFVCTPQRFPEGVEFSSDGNRAFLRVYIPRALPPVHPFSIQVTDSRGASGVGYYLLEFPSKLREFDNVSKIVKKRRREAVESRRHHALLGNLPMLRISQSTASTQQEKLLLSSFLDSLNLEPSLPFASRSVTEFVPSIVPPKPQKASGSINQLLMRTPSRKIIVNDTDDSNLPIDVDEEIQISPSMEVIDFGRSTRKRKIVQFASPEPSKTACENTV